MSDRKAALDGWYTLDDKQPQLIGSRCRSCNSYFFPGQTDYCRNPRCDSEDLVSQPLSRGGILWSFSRQHYEPPPPYVKGEKFTPYIIAAVELSREKMIVLGQVTAETALTSLKIGMPMQLVLAPLYRDSDGEYMVWNWAPGSPAP